MSVPKREAGLPTLDAIDEIEREAHRGFGAIRGGISRRYWIPTWSRR
jgi:hypothetical protein